MSQAMILLDSEAEAMVASGLSAASNPMVSIEDTQVMDLDDLEGARFVSKRPEVEVDPTLVSEMGRLRPPSRADSQDSCHTEEALEHGELNVQVKKTNLARVNSAFISGFPIYAMDTRPRGLALIIEIEQYENDVQERRIGSHHDVTNLTHLFEGLHFKVLTRQNLTKRAFWEELRSFAALDDHEDANMMILAVLSHGRDGHVYTSDNQVVATEMIYETFNNYHCPLLKGKPKFFIIQACRGHETDLGHVDPEVPLDLTSSPSRRVSSVLGGGVGVPIQTTPTKKKRRAGSMEMDATPFALGQIGDVSRARPTWEDMIMAYSTIPGYASMRDHDHGTWFIQSLVEVFMNHAHEKELIDLLRMTSERLSMFTNDYGEKQTCNVEMRHLYKRIYLNPGLPPSRPPSQPPSHHGSNSSLKKSQSSPLSSPLMRHKF